MADGLTPQQFIINKGCRYWSTWTLSSIVFSSDFSLWLLLRWLLVLMISWVCGWYRPHADLKPANRRTDWWWNRKNSTNQPWRHHWKPNFTVLIRNSAENFKDNLWVKSIFFSSSEVPQYSYLFLHTVNLTKWISFLENLCWLKHSSSVLRPNLPLKNDHYNSENFLRILRMSLIILVN